MFSEGSLEKLYEELKPTELMKEPANLIIYRIPVLLSHPNRLNENQRLFVDTLIREIKKALLLPRILPITERYM